MVVRSNLLNRVCWSCCRCGQEPYAAALNLQFVPKARYAQTPLQAGDQIEIIAPITGG